MIPSFFDRESHAYNLFGQCTLPDFSSICQCGFDYFLRYAFFSDSYLFVAQFGQRNTTFSQRYRSSFSTRTIM